MFLSVFTVCGRVADIYCVSLSSGLPRQAGDSASCGDEHSPEPLEGRLHPEEYDRCEHDVGTFVNQENGIINCIANYYNTLLSKHSKENLFKSIVYIRTRCLTVVKKHCNFLNKAPVVLQITNDVACFTYTARGTLRSSPSVTSEEFVSGSM